MNSQIAQAAKLVADYLYKNNTLGIQVCQDNRVCALINKDFISECGLTIDCNISTVELTTFNVMKSCGTISITKQAPVDSNTTPSTPNDFRDCVTTITAACTYTCLVSQPFPTYIRYNVNQEYQTTNTYDFSITSDRDYFERVIKSVVDKNGTVTISDEGGGDYLITVISINPIDSIAMADDAIDTNETLYYFDKNCSQ